MAICGYCNHSGYHAQFIPPGADPSKRCSDCPRCRQEESDQAGTAPLAERLIPGAGQSGPGGTIRSGIVPRVGNGVRPVSHTRRPVRREWEQLPLGSADDPSIL